MDNYRIYIMDRVNGLQLLKTTPNEVKMHQIVDNIDCNKVSICLVIKHHAKLNYDEPYLIRTYLKEEKSYGRRKCKIKWFNVL